MNRKHRNAEKEVGRKETKSIMKKNYLLMFSLLLSPILLWGQQNKWLSCPDDNHPHVIDLGLKSGTKWACCNIGASKPEDYGGYYCWGETEEKETYDAASYKTFTYVNNYGKKVVKKVGVISGTEYDVAYVKWGDHWSIPTVENFHELLRNDCRRRFISYHGVKGMIVIGPNENRIFFPFSGEKRDQSLIQVDKIGHYWSWKQNDYYWNQANELQIDAFDNRVEVWSEYVDIGCSVRAVYK